MKPGFIKDEGNGKLIDRRRKILELDLSEILHKP
jgi:hypothetical protein